jgi:hypothetical protein
VSRKVALIYGRVNHAFVSPTHLSRLPIANRCVRARALSRYASPDRVSLRVCQIAQRLGRRWWGNKGEAR